MSSSPPRSAQNTPSRTPLQERTQSQTNEISSRLLRNPKQDPAPQDVYTASPFPTKPQHVLLPSTIRKQKSARNLGADVFSPEYALRSPTDLQAAPTTPRRPAVRLKKSVKTLRDMYEAQSEDSRPSSAMSGGIRSRPGSAGSRLRSLSSNEGLSGRFAWEQLNKNRASDDMALLPSLPEGQSTLRQIGSKSSFAARSGLDATSSPNFRVLAATSSPRAPQSRPLAELSSEPSEDPTTDPSSIEQSSSSSPIVLRHARSSSLDELPSIDESSSPNFVKLGTSSPTRSVIRLAPNSSDEELPWDPSSSPNVVKLGTSSPARTLRGYEPSSPLQRVASSSSDSSKKRKQSDPNEGPSTSARTGAVNPFPSSSSIENASQQSFRSSPPEPPLVRTKSELIPASPDASSVLDAPYRYSYDQSSVADTHTTLQAALSSSPAPPVQYPVVRAPAPVQVAGLIIPKRKNRSSMTSETIMTPRWPSRLSAVPSDASLRSRETSKRSSVWDDADERFISDEIAPAAAYIMSDETTGSQIHITLESERHEEADDLVGALPGDEYGHRSPPVIRSASYGGTPSSSHSRLNSFPGSVENRLNSLTSRRGSLRRMSSASSIGSVAVPSWARRYYSGMYQDSFRYLMQSSSMVNVTQVPPPQQKPLPDRPESISTVMTSETPRSSRRSFASIRESLEKIPSLIRSKRPRLEPRKSHTMPGFGPLVSHPVRGPATAAMVSPKPSQGNMRSNLRPMSFPLHPADPRSQWAGYGQSHRSPGINPSYPGAMHQSSPSAPLASGGIPYQIPPRRMSRLPSISPHLHHDHRLNTGSTASRGYGHQRNRYSNPSDMFFDEKVDPKQSNPLRTGQIICFILGFLCPLAWFVGAFLPLPKRPDAFMDIEKSTWRRASYHGDLTEYEAMNVLAGLRKERRLRGGEEANWQNARWWRRLNRWMCLVGTVVLVLVIVLAVVGTTTDGLS